MLFFIGILLLLCVILPAFYAFLVHRRDIREKREELAKKEGKQG